MKTLILISTTAWTLSLAALAMGLLGIAQGQTSAAPPERDVSTVRVDQEGESWTLTGRKTRVTLREQDLSMVIRAGEVDWEIGESELGDLTVRVGAGPRKLRLADAPNRTVAAYHAPGSHGMEIRLDGFKVGEEVLDVAVRLLITLETIDDEVVFEVSATRGEELVRQIAWPRPWIVRTGHQSVVPTQQGMVLPADWPHKATIQGGLYSRAMSMPWWGVMREGEGAMLILETPPDVAIALTHPAGGPTRLEHHWLHSLGRFSTPRRARLCAVQGDYVAMAKRYRRHARETGLLVPLAEKAVRTPVLQRIVGAPALDVRVAHHISRDSYYFSKNDPTRNHQVTPFAELARTVQGIRREGIDRLYFHLDGWGHGGYDALHPDVLPPNEDAGGWDGLRGLIREAGKLGYVTVLHDQYRDYYLNSPSYHSRHTLMNESGDRPFDTVWFGGKQHFLCPTLHRAAATRTYRALADRNIGAQGANLDVYTAVEPDECYHPDHPMTRAECLRHYAEAFGVVREWSGLASSEELGDWAIPHTETTHGGPYPKVGIGVPLFNLVYHDALILPWGLGVEGGEDGLLWCLLNGGMPRISPHPDEAELKRVKAAAALHRRVAMLEMLGHEFLSGRDRQRSTFADGTRVSVDIKAGTWTIEPPLDQE